jgi:predicted ATPase/DNA-binding CsgD family transcriptional regulator
MTESMFDERVGNLPVDVTSFVGRRRELAEVRGLLSVSRLVTLTGMGGVGKTRLAMRAAAEMHRAFTDGVWLVELAGLQDAGLVGETVAVALGFQDHSVGLSVGTLSDLLAKRRLLLVLDNCEHLLDGCAVLADTLLRACPGLRILATSRRPLGIAGEHSVAVPPLSVPGQDRPYSSEGLAQYEAVTLFVERGAAVHAGFAIDASNEMAVAAICQRLDGIPLALELAAGRLRALSADQLLARLDDRYGLLTGGSRAALPRQQTLRALIDWSFGLCAMAEQLLWARLSVFTGGFDLDAAEAVCSGGEIPASEVLDLLAGLVEKSVVVAEDNGRRVRYQLSETLREYGRERLAEAGETQEMRHRHRDWCKGLVVRAEAGWFGPDQVDLFVRLGLEHVNIRSALSFCLTESGESEAGLAIASALRFYWHTSGRLNEGRHWLDQLLARHIDPSPMRLRGLYVCGYLATLLSDFAAAGRLLEEAQLLARQFDDADDAAYVTQIRGLAALFQGDPVRAAELLAQALEAHRGLGNLAAIAYDQIELALTAALLGDDHRAVGLFEECLALTESRGEHWIRGLALWALGVEACRQGDQRRATMAERESIRLRLPLDDRLNIGLNLKVLAWTASADGDGERAARLFGAAEAIGDAVGMSPTALGHLSGLQDQYETAARHVISVAAFDRAFNQGRGLGFDQAVAYALGNNGQPPGKPSPTLDTAVPGSLTRREREVAELITRGLSNREIARTLVIAQRTAEGHVEHILTKLGFTNRAQVAAWVAEQRATSDHD